MTALPIIRYLAESDCPAVQPRGNPCSASHSDGVRRRTALLAACIASTCAVTSADCGLRLGLFVADKVGATTATVALLSPVLSITLRVGQTPPLAILRAAGCRPHSVFRSAPLLSTTTSWPGLASCPFNPPGCAPPLNVPIRSAIARLATPYPGRT